MSSFTATFDAVARKAHNAARDAYNEAVLSQYRTDREFRAVVHAVATYAVETMPNPDGSKKIAVIVAIRDRFDGEIGLLGAKRLMEAMPEAIVA